MALPAGRYGVTKNQLLKIKKLPMNTIKLIEELTEKYDLLGTAAFKNSTSVVTDSTDLVESGAVLDTLRDAEVVEGKNKLQNIAVSTGIFTVNSDGTVTVNTGGTLAVQKIITISAPYTTTESMILNGTPSDGRDTTFAIFATDTDGLYYWDNYGEGVTIPSGKTITVYIVVRASQSLTNKVFKPMLQKATESDPTYEPYYIPLKDVVPNKCDNSVIGTVENGTNPTKSYEVDEFMVRDGAFCQVTAPVTTSSTWTEGSNYTKKSIAEVLQSLMS